MKVLVLFLILGFVVENIDGAEILRFKILARDLADKDAIGASDPYVKVFAKRGTVWSLLGKSEVIRNVQNPNFAYVFQDEYIPGSNQKIEFWDHDLLELDAFIGNAIMDVDAYYNNNKLATMPLSTSGTVTVLKSD